MTIPNRRWSSLCLLLLLTAIGNAMTDANDLFAVEEFLINRDGRRTTLTGRVEVEAQNGGVLLGTTDGLLWIVQPEEIVARKTLPTPFVPMTKEEMAKRLLAETGPEFKIHRTAHYVICYNTSKVYAEWCGALYERLYRAFYGFWSYKKVQLTEPEFPLVALVFKDQDSYARFTRQELGQATNSIIGYYNMRTNRVNMYDLTGVEGKRAGTRRLRSTSHVNEILSQPSAERTVATIVHEVTHQLAFNSGLQTRYADIPFWVSEGLAVYFETPDLRTTKGWRTIGAVNRFNLFHFRKSLRTREPNSLASLLSEDSRFRDRDQATAAYAEAWALSYFLIRTRTSQYVQYLDEMKRQVPLVDVSPEERLQRFKTAFGADLNALEDEFLKYVRRIR